MIVVHFEETHGSHDCWGKYEPYVSTEVVEFESVDAWLKYRKEKKVKLIALYKVSYVVREIHK